MTTFSIDKQRDQVNAEWMSRQVDERKPLALVLVSMAQSLTFSYRLKRRLLSGPNFGGAYIDIAYLLMDSTRRSVRFIVRVWKDV